MKMAFWQWMGMAVAAAMICMAVRIYQPQMAGLCAAAAGLMLLLWALDGLESVRQTFGRIASLGGLEEAYMQLLVKVMGVSYASEMAAQTCLDLGEGGLAVKVALAGKLCVFSLTAPMLIRMLEMILELVP